MIEAFAVYYLLVLLLFLSWRAGVPLGERALPSTRSTHYILAVFSIILFGLVLGLRYNVGGDYQGYVYYYEITSSHLSFMDVPFEAGFYWLIRALKRLELPPSSVFVATCALQMLFMTIWLRRHSFLGHWFFYFYFTTLVAFASMNTIRQALAFSIILSAIPLLIERRLLSYFAVIALGATLHASAIVFFPLYAVLNRDWISSRLWQVALLLLAYASANAIARLLFEMLPVLSVAVGYQNYAHVQGDLFFEHQASAWSPGLLFSLVTDLIVIGAYPRMKLTYERFGIRAYYNAYYIGAVVTPIVVLANYIPFSRFFFYFTAFKFVVLSFLVTLLFSRARPRYWGQGLGAALIAAYFGWFSLAIVKGAAWSAPFQFIFQ